MTKESGRTRRNYAGTGENFPLMIADQISKYEDIARLSAEYNVPAATIESWYLKRHSPLYGVKWFDRFVKVEKSRPLFIDDVDKKFDMLDDLLKQQADLLRKADFVFQNLNERVEFLEKLFKIGRPEADCNTGEQPQHISD